jgi:hypothetical protein
MAAMKPRTGDGPLEVTKEGRGIVMRVPLEGGGRLVVEMTPDEAETLSQELKNLNGLARGHASPTNPSIGSGGWRAFRRRPEPFRGVRAWRAPRIRARGTVPGPM